MSEHDPFQTLRERAETRLATQRVDLTRLVDTEAVQRLVHELQVHQIELEIQNEELRRLMAALQRSRDQFLRLFHHAPIGYVVLNRVGLIHEVNDTFCGMVRQQRSQLLGTPFVENLHEADRGVFRARYRAFFRQPVGKTLEVRIARAEGPPFMTLIEGAILEIPLDGLREQETPLLMLTVTDITEHKAAEEQRLQLERQMHQTQKLESLGVLAGGIAHDFNNMLTIILGNANLVLDELPPGSSAHTSLRAIERTALRAAELCRQMLAYSGRGRFIIEPVCLDRLIRDMMPLLQDSIAKKAQLHLHLTTQGSLPAVRGDPSQLRQAILNLVVNASEALGESGGVITISTGVVRGMRATLAECITGAAPLAEGDYAWFEVADTGPGIRTEIRQRIFEPFFTTKFTGRGLGLSAVLGIIRGHHGGIKVTTAPGQGAAFRVLLPVAMEEMPLFQPPYASLNTDIYQGTALLIDEEDTSRTLGARMLERIGFHVLAAEDGQAALELYQARRGEIVLVVLDRIMPTTDGIETFRQLRHLNPYVPVIITSSDASERTASVLTDQHRCEFLQKPYTFAALAACVQAVMGT